MGKKEKKNLFRILVAFWMQRFHSVCGNAVGVLKSSHAAELVTSSASNILIPFQEEVELFLQGKFKSQ